MIVPRRKAKHVRCFLQSAISVKLDLVGLRVGASFDSAVPGNLVEEER